MDTATEFGTEIVNRLKSTIRQKLSARHVPSLILPIDEIPYTVNGKKVILILNISYISFYQIKTLNLIV